MPAALLASERSVSLLRMPGRMILALVCAAGIGGSLPGAESIAFTSGRAIEGVVTAEMWAQRADFSGSFPTAGRMIAEVTGLPADCAVQIGSQGFSTSGSPVDWTDGEPGKPVRHTFTVESGQPGLVWVMIRNRASSVSLGDWAGVSCSASGPWYTLPRSGAAAIKGPADFEGRPVLGPITFAFRAGSEVEMAPKASSAKGTAAAAAEYSAFWFDAALGCGFEVPTGWHVDTTDPLSPRVLAPAGDPSEGVNLVVRVLPDATPARHIQRIHEERIQAGAELEVMGPLTVGGAEGVFVAHVTPGSVERNHADIVLRQGARCYRLTFEGRRELFEQATPQYRTVVGSFSFTDRRTTSGKEASR